MQVLYSPRCGRNSAHAIASAAKRRTGGGREPARSREDSLDVAHLPHEADIGSS